MSFRRAAPRPIEARFAVRSDVGSVRTNNEDDFVVADLSAEQAERAEAGELVVGPRGLLFAVCDGMGGAAAGEMASGLATITTHRALRAAREPKGGDELAEALVAAIGAASEAIWAASQAPGLRGMGTTATVAALVDDRLLVGQVGDSRGYVYRRGRLAQVTRDQTLAQQLIDAGQMTPEEAEDFEHSNVILQALGGTGPSPLVDVTEVRLREGDTLLLCSDGLSGLVKAPAIAEALAAAATPAEACDALVGLALRAGGHDNVTCVVVRFGGGLAPPSRDDEGVSYRKFSPSPPAPAGEPGDAPARPTAAADEPIELPLEPRPLWPFALLLAGVTAGLLVTCLSRLPG